jgi:maleylacetoacetate isomerase
MNRQLYTFFRSSASYRLRIALACKGLPYDPRYVSLPRMEHREPAYRALNPQGLVPLLVDEGKALTQSMAIIEYLDEKYPEPRLMPADIDGRAYVRAASQIVGCDIHPLNNVRVLKRLQSQFGADENAVTAWYRHWIKEGLSSLETYVAQEGRAGTYLHANQVTMADICLVPQIFNAQRFSCPLDGYPTLMRVFESCVQLPAFRDTQPSTQADAVA